MKIKNRPLIFPISPIFLISLVLLLVLGPLTYFRLLRPGKTHAGWFNDFWGYRTAITITNSGSAVTNQKVKLDIATDALYTAGKIPACADSAFVATSAKEAASAGRQINCNDSRFTDINSKIYL